MLFIVTSVNLLFGKGILFEAGISRELRIMKVSFKSEGGFGFFPGLNKPVEIDSSELPADEANHLEKLVDKAQFFAQPEASPPPTKGADFKTYTISVDNQGQQHKIEVTDLHQNSELQDLLSYLRKKQKEARGK